MQTTSTHIVNMALARLGQPPIASLDEGSPAANAAKLVYDTCRRNVLQAYLWSFASRVASLNRLLETPPDYRCAFQLPPDCLNVVRLRPARSDEVSSARVSFSDALPFVVRGDRLYTDQESATIEYTADVTEESRFEAHFTEAFVVRLASELAMPVGAKGELMLRFREEYEATVRQAAARSQGQFYEECDDNPYLHARW